ncbi:uncharacterized protein LOC142317282 isoform X2 [Lycorma delicatula]|uniref:uncharacterized protein LOC142317282 isoform X2 n=1 Tax=Lycorma delicatula TaxID=130591 RepID=UPI003F5171EF
MDSAQSERLENFDGKKIDCAFNNHEVSKHQELSTESAIIKIDQQLQVDMNRENKNLSSKNDNCFYCEGPRFTSSAEHWGDSTLSETIQILVRTMKIYSDLQQSVLESENHCSIMDLQYKCTPLGHGEVGRSDAMNLADNMHLLMHMHSRLHNRLLTAVVNQRGGISPQHLISTDLSSPVTQTNPSETQPAYGPEKSIHKCPQCGKFLVSKRNLKYHMKLHTGDMDHKCYICSKGFTHKNKLLIHIKLHTGQKDFVCTVCSKAFVQKCDLLRHTKLHTGQKDFVCGVCSKGFIQRSDLLKHSKLHTGQKDFVCTVCSKAFIQKSDLLRHNKTHWPDRCHV